MKRRRFLGGNWSRGLLLMRFLLARCPQNIRGCVSSKGGFVLIMLGHDLGECLNAPGLVDRWLCFLLGPGSGSPFRIDREKLGLVFPLGVRG